MIEYFNEDCMVGMARYPDKHFDLAIVDPPYGIGAGKGTRVINPNHTWKGSRDRGGIITGEWDNKIPDKQYFEELFRVSKNQIIWGGNYFILPSNNNWIIWDKKIKNHTFSPFEMAWSSNGKCKIFRWMLEGYKSENPREMQNRFHPTQKPVALYKWLLKNYANQGDLILDTHVGSASSLIACHDMGFDAVGFEIDPDYYKASKQRLERHMAQIQITDLAPVIKPEQIAFTEVYDK